MGAFGASAFSLRGFGRGDQKQQHDHEHSPRVQPHRRRGLPGWVAERWVHLEPRPFPCEALAEAIKSNSTITNINLASNSIGVEGCQAGWLRGGCIWCFGLCPCEALAEALNSNSTITNIDLWNNDIGDEGCKAWWLRGGCNLEPRPCPCKALAEAIKSNSTITNIHLGNNRIGVEGCKAWWLRGGCIWSLGLFPARLWQRRSKATARSRTLTSRATASTSRAARLGG